ncbi:AzlC family ABC transporter permease [Streptomyces sp. ISL-11]|uniref:AzlC family ABC transporter permease n=1 Tax=Streptomyces sp. ISL-11 TaxID=2819174 RepID=UPI001BEC12E5|nr:AzlC family ABC transporter permease [Streptomyces sp. ISL-11]MBT2387356.1 AzlC family ABC transporter permease [Streptomyces sp. ISL-11]
MDAQEALPEEALSRSSSTPLPEAAAPEAGFREELLYGLRAAVPLAVAVFGFAVSFGVVARAAGMGVLAPLVMSLTTFAGSAQFAAASVLGTGGGVAAAIVAAVLLNSRYLPIGISVAPAMTGGVLKRFLSAQLVVDESWAVGHVGNGRYSRGRLLGAGVLVYCAWVGGTAVGLLGARYLGDPERFGLDVVSPVLFLALLKGQITSRKALAASVLGVAIALTLVPFASPGVPLIAATAACLLGLRKR